ncbi:MAG: T9SS type A sorting domain-containing protein [Chitinophagales bacterium]
MKSLLAIAAALLLSMNSANAQSTDEVAVNTTSKSQLQKIEDFNNRAKVEVKVFPNPAKDVLYIEPVLNADKGLIKIMDITGRVLNEMHLECGCNQLEVDLSSYINGLYVLTLYDENGRLVHIKRFYKE